jgi:hypothetical protein
MDNYFMMFMARSGSTWLGKILSAHPQILYHQHAWANGRGRLTEDEIAGLGKRLKRLAADHSHRFDCAPHFPTVITPGAMVLKDSHLAQKPGLCASFGRLIVLIRDPRAQINSLINHYPPGKQYGIQASAERWGERYDQYLGIRDEAPGKVHVVKFERLLKDPMAEINKIFKFMGMPGSTSVDAFVEQSGSKHDAHWKSIYKDRDTVNKAWRLKLSPGAQDTIKQAVKGSRAAKLYGL